MTFRSILLALLAAATLATACDSPEPGPTIASDLEAPAKDLIELLVASRYEAFASRMHYPDIYTPEQLAEDRAGVVSSLSVLLREAGAIQQHTRSEDRGPFLLVNVAGGDDSYWQTHPAGKGGSSVVYDVTFATIGEGVVQIGFASTPDGTEVRNVGIGVKASRPDARATMESIMAKLKNDRTETAQAP
jgi:hypothetical protein